MIKITSKKDGFRRCGMAHSKEPVEHSDDWFSEEDLEILKAEPMLIVETAEEMTPPEPTEEELIEAAREAIVSGKITNDGKPTVGAMMAILGRPVTAQDRDAAWEKIQAEGSE